MSKKPAGDRAALIKWRLGNMIEFVQKLKDKGWNEAAAASEDKYIRVLGESCRAVSLNDVSPLCGFGGTGSKDISKVFQHFDDVKRKPAELAEDDWRIKKERRLQSWIVKEALMNGRDLLQSPIFECLKDSFDELVFALDEVSFGDKNHEPPKTVRCDLLAVGVKKNGDVIPVVIELKTLRSLGRLLEQLENAEREISAHKEEVRSLMALTTGKNISSFSVMKILVWPHGEESKNTADRRKASGVIFVEYTPNNFAHPNVLTAKLPSGG